MEEIEEASGDQDGRGTSYISNRHRFVRYPSQTMCEKTIELIGCSTSANHQSSGGVHVDTKLKEKKPEIGGVKRSRTAVWLRLIGAARPPRALGAT